MNFQTSLLLADPSTPVSQNTTRKIGRKNPSENLATASPLFLTSIAALDDSKLVGNDYPKPSFYGSRFVADLCKFTTWLLPKREIRLNISQRPVLFYFFCGEGLTDFRPSVV